ncbi:MAG: hypothetical protein HQK87_07765 [Nitrospinae bacterium]|nr:hypothetical protein [Nitrospinota bacterium]
MTERASTGVAGLDEALGGGLIPGTVTIVHGATGAGKTQLGVAFAAAGAPRGLFLDLNARGDRQGHHDYARRMAGWALADCDIASLTPTAALGAAGGPGDFAAVFEGMGKRPHREQVSDLEWLDWNVRLQSVLQATGLFFLSSFMAGRRAVVVDGLEPTDHAVDSAQYEFFEYLAEQVFHRRPDLLAKEALRENYRRFSPEVERRPYDPRQVTVMAMATAREMSLDAMIDRSLAEGDLYAVANTVILMGRIREGSKIGRLGLLGRDRPLHHRRPGDRRSSLKRPPSVRSDITPAPFSPDGMADGSGRPYDPPMEQQTPIPMEARSLAESLAPVGLAPRFSRRALLLWRGLAELYGSTLFDRPLGWSDRDTYEQLLDRPVMAPSVPPSAGPPTPPAVRSRSGPQGRPAGS